MSTVSLSLPIEQLEVVDSLVGKYGFANRSEFVRSLLRFVTHDTTFIEKAATFPFVAPVERSTQKIISDFQKSQKYSPEFLKDLEEGLLSSDYFTA